MKVYTIESRGHSAQINRDKDAAIAVAKYWHEGYRRQHWEVYEHELHSGQCTTNHTGTLIFSTRD